jgi:hypothetical protein
MSGPGLTFSYFGPETVLPMTSILATVVGLFLMFGRQSVRLVLGCWDLVRPRGRRARAPRPHLAARRRVSSGELVGEPGQGTAGGGESSRAEA